MYFIHYSCYKHIGSVWRGIKTNPKPKNSTAPGPPPPLPFWYSWIRHCKPFCVLLEWQNSYRHLQCVWLPFYLGSFFLRIGTHSSRGGGGLISCVWIPRRGYMFPFYFPGAVNSRDMCTLARLWTNMYYENKIKLLDLISAVWCHGK